jgi:hypothetical protein
MDTQQDVAFRRLAPASGAATRDRADYVATPTSVAPLFDNFFHLNTVRRQSCPKTASRHTR